MHYTQSLAPVDPAKRENTVPKEETNAEWQSER